MQKLERTTFETSRSAEYFDARQLSTLTGVAQHEFASVCLKKLIDNALDACETAGVAPEVGVGVGTEEVVDEGGCWAHPHGLLRISVSGNGPGIPPQTVRKVLDFNTRTSDKAAYRSPTRGAQGNALKTVIGIPYALGRAEPLIIIARGVRHEIRLWVDPAGEVHISHQEAPVPETVGTKVSLGFSRYVPGTGDEQAFDPLHWVRSFAAFNPHATFGYQAKSGPYKGAEMYKSSVAGRSRSTHQPSPPRRIGTARSPSKRSSSAT